MSKDQSDAQIVAALDGLTKNGGGVPLKVDVILDSLEGEVREAVLRALRDPARVSDRALSEVLNTMGHRISAAAIYNWRGKPGNLS